MWPTPHTLPASNQTWEWVIFLWFGKQLCFCCYKFDKKQINLETKKLKGYCGKVI